MKFLTRDVIFHKQLFPFQQDSSAQTDPYLVSPKFMSENSSSLDIISDIVILETPSSIDITYLILTYKMIKFVSVPD